MAVMVTYGLVVAFFLWGFSTPTLDRVWTVRLELKIGKMKRLRRADRQLLVDALGKHDWLARALIDNRDVGLISANSDGWIATPTTTILRTAGAKTTRAIVFDIQTPEDLLPYEIQVKGPGWREELKVEKHGILRFTLPDPPQVDEIIEVRLRGSEFTADPSVLGTRITFSETR
jgi:hypothetical protein